MIEFWQHSLQDGWITSETNNPGLLLQDCSHLCCYIWTTETRCGGRCFFVDQSWQDPAWAGMANPTPGLCHHFPSVVRSHSFDFPIWLQILLFFPSASLFIQSITYWVLWACTDLGAWELSVNNAKQDSCPLHSNGEDKDNRHHKYVNNSNLEGGKCSGRSKNTAGRTSTT